MEPRSEGDKPWTEEWFVLSSSGWELEVGRKKRMKVVRAAEGRRGSGNISAFAPTFSECLAHSAPDTHCSSWPTVLLLTWDLYMSYSYGLDYPWSWGLLGVTRQCQ